MIKDVQLKLASPSMDNNYIYWLQEQQLFDKSCVSSVYYPIFVGDGVSARSWTDNSIRDWKSYARLLKECMNAGFPVEVLMQSLDKIPLDTFKRYLDLGVRKFTIAQDFNAIALRELDEDVFISASITKALSPTEICDNDLSMYDEVCLFFFYNFNFDAIKSLPKNIEYSICGNTGCMPFCQQCLNHWFSNEMADCRYNRAKGNGWEPGFTYEEYKLYLDKHISRVKILDRLSSFEQMVECTEAFFDTTRPIHDYDYFNKQKEFPRILNKERLFYGKH